MNGDPDRSSLVAFVRPGTSDSGNRQPDVSAQEGGCSHRHFTDAPLRDQRTVGDLKQLLDGALVGHHPALNQRLASTPRAIVALSWPQVSDSATASCDRREVTSRRKQWHVPRIPTASV